MSLRKIFSFWSEKAETGYHWFVRGDYWGERCVCIVGHVCVTGFANTNGYTFSRQGPWAKGHRP